jgi:prepilin-type N-terminal cleavage/methylation domain-containing protein
MSMSLRLFGGHQRGDTIVEVLIAIAIASLMLAGGYSITTQNLRSLQDANERSQALQLAQKQVELLRIYAGNQSGSFTLTNQCLDDNIQPQSATVTANPNSCNISPSGASSCGVSFCYNVSITGSSSYEVTIQWQNTRKACVADPSCNTSKVALDYKPAI